MSPAEIIKLRQENEGLREQVAWFEGLFREAESVTLQGRRLPSSFSTIVRLLLARDFVSHEALDFALFQDEDRSSNIVSVYICKLRGILRPLAVDIETVWGKGYRLDRENRERLRALIAPEPEKLSA